MKGLSIKLFSGLAIILIALAVWGWLALAGRVPQGKEGLWGGVDVNVTEQFAAEAGREAQEPLINTDQGDLLLFVFAMGGAVGGFVAGYYWRRLISEKDKNNHSE